MMPDITVQKAEHCHVDGIVRLLRQTGTLHHIGRPDIFREGAQKYTASDIRIMMANKNRPIFVAVSDGAAGAVAKFGARETPEAGEPVAGYAFCEIKKIGRHNIFVPRTTLFVDDLCVDENLRGGGIGKIIFTHIFEFAKGIGADDIDLNVWAFNEEAVLFYESLGFGVRAYRMEVVL